MSAWSVLWEHSLGMDVGKKNHPSETSDDPWNDMKKWWQSVKRGALEMKRERDYIWFSCTQCVSIILCNERAIMRWWKSSIYRNKFKNGSHIDHGFRAFRYNRYRCVWVKYRWTVRTTVCCFFLNFSLSGGMAVRCFSCKTEDWKYRWLKCFKGPMSYTFSDLCNHNKIVKRIIWNNNKSIYLQNSRK